MVVNAEGNVRTTDEYYFNSKLPLYGLWFRSHIRIVLFGTAVESIYMVQVIEERYRTAFT